jgi:hypothetical protein
MTTMKVLLCLLTLASSAFAQTPPTKIPAPTSKESKAINKIARDYAIKFAGPVEIQDGEHKKFIYWTFVKMESESTMGVVIVAVPKFPTDKQMVDAFACSVVASHFYELVLKGILDKMKERTATPESKPSPSPSVGILLYQ